MAIDQEAGTERVVEVSLRMARAKELSTLGRVVRVEPDADARPMGRVLRERVRPGSLLAFGCVVRERPTAGTSAQGRVPRVPHP
jgi:hypothetical protein